VRLGADRVRVTVPATSANLGPGYDSLGLALDLRDELEVFALASDEVQVEVVGEGAGEVPTDARHLVARAVRIGLDHVGAPEVGLRLVCRNVIPHGRGLGSSAAAVVAGLFAARGLIGDPTLLDDDVVLDLATQIEGHPDNAAPAILGGAAVVAGLFAARGLIGDPTLLDDDVVLDLATQIEGHPDNAAPAILGGATVAWSVSSAAAADGAVARAARFDVAEGIEPLVLVPQERLSTHRARGVLPTVVPHEDAAFNAARSALLVAALGGRPELLLEATADRLHQGYRAEVMRASADLVGALRGAGLAAVVSGAGPTVLVLGAEADRARQDEVLASVLGVVQEDGTAGGWRTLRPGIARGGATVEQVA